QCMGEGATEYVGETISGLGTNMLIAQPGSSRTFGPPNIGVPLFTTLDVEAIRRHARDVKLIVPVNMRVLRTVAGSNNHSVNVVGVSSEYFTIRQWDVSQGR